MLNAFNIRRRRQLWKRYYTYLTTNEPSSLLLGRAPFFERQFAINRPLSKTSYLPTYTKRCLFPIINYWLKNLSGSQKAASKMRRRPNSSRNRSIINFSAPKSFKACWELNWPKGWYRRLTIYFTTLEIMQQTPALAASNDVITPPQFYCRQISVLPSHWITISKTRRVIQKTGPLFVGSSCR